MKPSSDRENIQWKKVSSDAEFCDAKVLTKALSRLVEKKMKSGIDERKGNRKESAESSESEDDSLVKQKWTIHSIMQWPISFSPYYLTGGTNLAGFSRVWQGNLRGGGGGLLFVYL